jgi:ATPase subunit of ABC transporter with duplicated ATPase domains
MTTVYGWLLAIALLVVGGWYTHNRVYQSGFDAAKKADDKALDQAADANATFQRTLETLKASVKECEDGRATDTEAAKRAAEEADHARAEIAAKAKKASKALADRMAGECREWATQPACGSVP